MAVAVSREREALGQRIDELAEQVTKEMTAALSAADTAAWTPERLAELRDLVGELFDEPGEADAYHQQIVSQAAHEAVWRMLSTKRSGTA